jgi:two-component system phosphate regulon response regulator PhoB
VLVVEAEEAERQNVCRILRDVGYEVLEAENSDHARRKILRSDTVIVGASMPNTESRTLCTEIKSRHETANLPIVVLSRHEGGHETHPPDRHGACDAHLKTPLRRSELLTTLEALMQARWAALRAQLLGEEVETDCCRHGTRDQ